MNTKLEQNRERQAMSDLTSKERVVGPLFDPKLYFLDAPKEQPGTCFVKHEDYVALVRGYRVLQDQLQSERSLRAARDAVHMLRRLQDYIQHPHSCELQRWFKGTAEPKRCTCGLQSILNDASALVKRIEGAPSTKGDGQS